jgi:UDP-glucose 4-epimerase
LRNRRSLLARDNLVTAIHLALTEPGTMNETYVVADPAPLSVAEMVGALRAGLGRRPGLLPVPPQLLALALRTSGRSHLWERISGACIVDPAKLLAAGWRPATDTRAGLAAMAQAASPAKSGTASRRMS